MKKLLSLALALVLCLSLTVPAFAAEDEVTCQILKVGDTTFTLNGITFTLSGPILGQVAVEDATYPRTGKIVNVVADNTIISCAPASDDIAEKISVEYYDIDRETNLPNWMPADADVFVDGGILGSEIYLFASMGEGDELPVYLQADSKAIAGAAQSGTTANTETTGTTAAPKFTDVAADSPFAPAIAWAVEQGITKGTTPTTFGPGDTCTIRQILTFLCRANTGDPNTTLDAACAWAMEQGMISEHDDTTVPCTRAAAVTFMWQAAGSPEVESEKEFTDVDADASYVQAVAWAVSMKVTAGTGDGTTFSPDNTCTRGQIVTFLYRADAAAQQ